MFTGLITDVGLVTAVKRHNRGETLVVATNYDTSDLVLGESIACNGACLTVTRINDGYFEVDATIETLSRTTLACIASGERIHLERALRVGDRLGGHYVTGHIDVVGKLISVGDGSQAHDSAMEFGGVELGFEAPESFAPMLVEKGSVAINGVSLTVNHLEDIADGVRFKVMIIPFTYKETEFSNYEIGQKVNLEGDLFAKYIKRLATLGTVKDEGNGSRVQDALDLYW